MKSRILTVRFRGSEVGVIDGICGKKCSRAKFIRQVLFVPGPSKEAVALFTGLAQLGKEPENRIVVSFRVTRAELGELRTLKTTRKTLSDIVREQLGLRPISFWFRPAALALSRRGNRPVVTRGQIEDWRRIAEARARFKLVRGEVRL